jgi:hypothetical protein
MKLILLLSLLFISSCFQGQKRVPSSTQRPIYEIIESFKEMALEQKAYSKFECISIMKNAYEELVNVNSQDMLESDLTVDKLEELINHSFETRLLMKERLKQLRGLDADGAECLSAFRDTFRALRYTEDYAIELLNLKKANNSEHITLKGDSYHFQINPKYKSSFSGVGDLRSGDVILSRGNAFSSAAIARIGKSDAQFSHLTLVYKNPNDQDTDLQLWTIEAHIEIGSVVAPIQVHIDQGNSRTVILRYKDSVLADKAGQIMFDKVKARSDKNDNIKYDFGMDYHNNDLLFCSEIIYDGFHLASEGKLNIPQYKTKFNPGLSSFLDIMGIDTSNIETLDTFSPADIEYDEDFEIIAEWRNPSKLRSSRFNDAILSKIFQWIIEEKYKFDATASVRAGSVFAHFARRFGAFSEDFPVNMKRKQLNLFRNLDVVGGVLYDKLEAAQMKSITPLSFKEIYSILEEVKKADLIVYDIWKRKSILRPITKKIYGNKIIFHKQLHP